MLHQETALSTVDTFVAGNAITIDDLQAEALYAAGHQFYETGDYVRAADLFRLLALARPLAARSWLALGATHEAADDLDRAAALYSVAAQSEDATNDEAATALLYRARVTHALGDVDGARADVAVFHELASETLASELEPIITTLALSEGERA